MTILIAGATGLVGQRLIKNLLVDGHNIRALVRNPSKITQLPGSSIFKWLNLNETPLNVFDGVDVVIHLAGENIGDKRWTKERKELLRSSRINSTQALVKSISDLTKDKRPRCFIMASAIGFYGSDPEKAFTEESAQGHDFLANLCADWEHEGQKIENFGVRLVQMRFGLVLSPDGGVLKKLGPVVLGGGKQWTSWIHIDDLCEFIKTALLDENYKGIYNLVSPNPLTHREMIKKLSKKVKFPFTISVPEFALKLALGELADAVLSSQKALPQRALAEGFKFKYEVLDSALDDIYSDRV